MDLSWLIEEINKPQYAGLSDADATALVNSQQVNRICNDLLTTRSLIINLGVDDATTALNALAQAASSNPMLDAMRITLCSTGIDFSNQLSQSVIDQLATTQLITQELASKLKRLGRWTEPISIQFMGREVTGEDVRTCRDQMHKSALLEAARVRIGRVTAGIATGEINSEAEMVSVFGA